jgi:hypothetical protein
MKRLGENVFQFGLAPRGDIRLLVLAFTYGLLPLGAFFIFLSISLLDFGCFILAILSVALWFIIGRPAFRLGKSGVILDKEKGIITLNKWTFIGPQKFEEIQISEIMGTERDVDTSTKTELINNKWRTTESNTYNIVLQGKFGSHRFSLWSRDDWNLFTTLLYGE